MVDVESQVIDQVFDNSIFRSLAQLKIMDQQSVTIYIRLSVMKDSAIIHKVSFYYLFALAVYMPQNLLFSGLLFSFNHKF